MNRSTHFPAFLFVVLFSLSSGSYGQEDLEKINNTPDYKPSTEVTPPDASVAPRGRIGAFKGGSDKIQFQKSFRKKDGYRGKKPIQNAPKFKIGDVEPGAIKIKYNKSDTENGNYSGLYQILRGNFEDYQTLVFLIRGQSGGEKLHLAGTDLITNFRQDSIPIGSIYRYLPGGITTQWQLVTIPLQDFFGMNKSEFFSLIFEVKDLGAGTIYIDELRISKKKYYSREEEIRKKGFLEIDNFNHGNLNLLGGKVNRFQRLPSKAAISKQPQTDGNRILKLDYEKLDKGWCGFYLTLTPPVISAGPEYFIDISNLKYLYFKIKGEKGLESIALQLADREMALRETSFKIDDISDFIESGKITTSWQEVKIPITALELNLKELATISFAIQDEHKGTVYFDDIRIY